MILIKGYNSFKAKGEKEINFSFRFAPWVSPFRYAFFRRKMMKKVFILTIGVALIFYFSGISIAGQWKEEPGKGHPPKSQYQDGHRNQDRDHKRVQSDKRVREEQRGRSDYRRYPGYGERPHGGQRHYEHQNFGGHRYAYHGHWRSWNQWNQYKRQHPEMKKYGSYYRENGHLMFRFRNPVTGAYFFFSIGK